MYFADERGDKPPCVNGISTTNSIDGDITKNNRNNAATSSSKCRRRNEKKKKRNRLLKQKLNDYQKLFEDLLEKDLVTERGKKLISSKSFAFNSKTQFFRIVNAHILSS